MTLFRHSVLAALLAGVVAIGAGAEDRKALIAEKESTLDDNTFVEKAASGNSHEVALNELAVGRAENKDVQTFAQRMIKDHNNAQTQLKDAAKAAGIKMPGKMSKEHQAHVDHFAKMKKGRDFDASFLKHMVKDHEKAIELYESAVKSVKHSDLRKYAEKTLPTIRDHLKAAKRLNDDLGGK